MTTHELARALLELPDVLVVKNGHEPNEECYDEIKEAVPSTGYQYIYSKGRLSDLCDGYFTGNKLPVVETPVVILQ